jgi:hypothetical protein
MSSQKKSTALGTCTRLLSGAVLMLSLCMSATAAKKSEPISVLAVGDLILDRPDIADRFGDVVIGNVEFPHTNRGHYSSPESAAAPGVDPENLNPLRDAGFNVATMAHNHTFDQGYYGVADTIDKLRSLGILHAGAGLNIDEARRPAFIEKKGVKVAVLNYNAIGPELSWATPLKAGANFLRVKALYHTDESRVGGPPQRVYTIVDRSSLKTLQNDVAEARKQADVVFVSLHMGYYGGPSLQEYQLVLSRAAIDAGADIIVAMNSHALLGIEIYNGKPIFHGLGNFVTLSDVFLPTAANAAQWNWRPFNDPATAPREIVGYVKDQTPPPGSVVPFYPWDEASRNTMIAKVNVTKTGIVDIRYVPCYIDEKGSPVPLTRDNGGQKVFDFVVGLTKGAGLDTRFRWSDDGTEVIVER